MLAYDYPILGLFWTMMIFFLWIAWLFLLFRVFADIFRSDMGGGAKALWSIFVILAPFLGVFIYVIANGRAMGERDIAKAQQRESEMQAYIRESAGSCGWRRRAGQARCPARPGRADRRGVLGAEGQAALLST